MKEDKREEYISWDSYFLGLAALASFRSKDPSTANGASIIDPQSNSILAVGYNGFPVGCSDDEFPWVRKADNKNNAKYSYAEHSERNAIYSAARKGIALNGSVLYLYSEKGYYPCAECARAIIQSGIQKVVMAWAIEDDTDKYSWEATLRMFRASGVEVKILCPEPYVKKDADTPQAKESQKIIDDFCLIEKKMGKISIDLWKKGGSK